MSFVTGVRSFTDALALARRPELRRFFWTPAVVALGIILPTLALAFAYADDGVTWLVGQLPGWLDFLAVVLVPLAYVVGVLVAVFSFGYLAAFVASPFLGELSSRTETLAFGETPASDAGWVKAAAEAFRRELRKLAYHLPRLAGVFLVSLVPVVTPFAPALWFLFAAWTMAVQFADFPGENRGQPFEATLARLKSGRATTLGFGIPAAFALSLPLINFLAIPIAVIGGTLLWHRLGERGR